MEPVVQLIILSANQSGDAFVVVKDNSIPQTALSSGTQPLDVACDLLKDTCGIPCLPEEFLLADEIYSVDSTLTITYCIIIPYNINNQDGKYKYVRLKDFMNGHHNEYNLRIMGKMLYKV